MMLFMDPPEHHRYRKLVRDPFAPRAPRHTASGSRSWPRRSSTSSPVGTSATSSRTSQANSRPTSSRISSASRSTTDAVSTSHREDARGAGLDPEAERGSAAMEMIMYAAQVRAAKLESPESDLASDLVTAWSTRGAHGGRVRMVLPSVDQRRGDTTRNAVGGGMLALFEHPDELRRLQNDLDALLPSAVEEILRWVSPVVYMRRTAKRNAVVRGVEIAEGTSSRCTTDRRTGMTTFSRSEHLRCRTRPNDHIAFGPVRISVSARISRGWRSPS